MHVLSSFFMPYSTQKLISSGLILLQCKAEKE